MVTQSLQCVIVIPAVLLCMLHAADGVAKLLLSHVTVAGWGWSLILPVKNTFFLPIVFKCLLTGGHVMVGVFCIILGSPTLPYFYKAPPVAAVVIWCFMN